MNNTPPKTSSDNTFLSLLFREIPDTARPSNNKLTQRYQISHSPKQSEDMEPHHGSLVISEFGLSKGKHVV